MRSKLVIYCKATAMMDKILATKAGVNIICICLVIDNIQSVADKVINSLGNVIL